MSLAFAAIVAVVVGPAAGEVVKDRVRAAFEEFVERYGKAYGSREEEQARFDAFKSNFAFVESENAKDKSYKLTINGFADMGAEDFGGKRLGFNAPAHAKAWAGRPHLGTHRRSDKVLPESVDWFLDGAVTPIKDQGQCGSCWTFSTTGALEGAWRMESGTLVALSEQQLIDCAKNDGLDGCNGGEMDPAFTYLKDHAVCSEDGYSYAGNADGTCHDDTCTVAIPIGGVVGFEDVAEGDQEALEEAVAKQPVATAVQAGQPAFQMYNSGVLTQNCSANVDHAVLIVGYGTDNGVNYWKIKNSWGPSWGEDGFIRLARGKPDDGECGVKVMPSYPVVRQVETLV